MKRWIKDMILGGTERSQTVRRAGITSGNVRRQRERLAAPATSKSASAARHSVRAVVPGDCDPSRPYGAMRGGTAMATCLI